MARSGAAEDPPVPVPPLLRPVINFSRLNAKALDAARRAVDDDEGFRTRVAEAVDEARVGRSGWLWLRRPDGWAEEMAGLVELRAEADAEADLARRLQQSERDVEAAEVAARRAEDARRRASEEAAKARADLDVERRARRSTEELVAGLEARIRDMDRARTELEQQLDRAKADAAAHEEELARRAEAMVELEDRLAQARTHGVEPERHDDERLADALDRARRATDEASRALGEALSELDADRASEPPAVPRPPRPPRGRRRAAVRLPPPLVDNTAEAIVHLIRQAGATVLVDGYNISMAAWPGTRLTEQRERLVDALDGLHARYGTDVVVVFDGDTGGRRPSAAHGRSIKALFTAAGEIADDRIVALVSSIPGDAPVLVVTSDRELKDRARAAGAHVASARPFLSVLLR